MKTILFGLIAVCAWAQSPVIRDGCAAAGASGTTYTCSYTVSPGAYLTGHVYFFKADVANTGAATINLNSIGAIGIKKVVGGITTALVANDLQAGQWATLIYDGTNMQMQSVLGNAPGGGGGGVTFTANVGHGWMFGDPQNPSNVAVNSCVSVTCFTEWVTPVSYPVGGFTMSVVHNMASGQWIALGLYDSTCTLISGTTGNFQGAGGTVFANITVTASIPAGVYFLGIAGTASSFLYMQSTQAFGFLNQAATPRQFTGNAPTGSAGTLATAGTCGSRTGITPATQQLNPVVALVP